MFLKIQVSTQKHMVLSNCLNHYVIIKNNRIHKDLTSFKAFNPTRFYISRSTVNSETVNSETLPETDARQWHFKL